MKSLKNILKTALYMTLFFIFLSFILTIFNYFNILNYKTVNILKIITLVISYIFGGFIIGKKSDKNGWLEGIKLSSFINIVLIFTSVILKEYKHQYLIYILVLTISSVLGSMIGINKK